MRAKFIPGVTDEYLRKLIEDIRKFMREDLVSLETNKRVIGMKYLFRCFSIEAQNGTHFDEKHKTQWNSKSTLN